VNVRRKHCFRRFRAKGEVLRRNRFERRENIDQCIVDIDRCIVKVEYVANQIFLPLPREKYFAGIGLKEGKT
jgi:hypothetical protein